MPCSIMSCRTVRCLFVVGIVFSQPAAAGDALHRITWTDGKQQHLVEGRILVEAQDGGILLQSRDGTLRNITPDKLRRREKTDEVFKPLSSRKLGEQLQAEFGNDFQITTTRHYVLCSNAGAFYTQWCGALLERLTAAFLKHWRSGRLKLHRPTFPLVAVIFATQKQFAAYATRDAGPALADSVGYYSVRTNRIVLRDLTAGPNSRPAGSVDGVRRKVRASPFNVATVVHEATHQIAFNSGLHTRYADNPLWLTEGLAMYFETPDLRNPKGWRTVGKPNPFRLRRFRAFAAGRRKPGSLQSLITDKERFTNAKTGADAYAEAWALTYFLIKTRRKQYETYLNGIAEKPRLIWDSPEQRLKEFQQAFGNLKQVEGAFLRFMSNRRLR